jgi:uncharacterized protein (DUF302 family)
MIMTIEGLETLPSLYDSHETSARLARYISTHGMSLFARIDHAAGAAEAGLPLRPTEVLIYGNAKGGTPLMQIDQAFGIELPLRALIWQDESGKTWVSYTPVNWLIGRRPVDAGAVAVATKLDSVQRQVALYATGVVPAARQGELRPLEG